VTEHGQQLHSSKHCICVPMVRDTTQQLSQLSWPSPPCLDTGKHYHRHYRLVAVRGRSFSGIREAWNKAMTSSNIIAAFEKSGICPFNPEAYQVNKMDEPQQNTTCLEMIHAAIQAHPAIANESDIVPSVVRSLLPILNPPEADMPVDLIDKCTHCGTNLKKKRYQQMLNTKAGMLLTKVELVAMIAQHEKEEEEKKQTAASKKVAAAERKSHAANKKRSRSKKNDADAHANAGVDADGDHTDTDDDADKENHDPLPALTPKRYKQQNRCNHSSKTVQRQSSIVLPDIGPLMISIQTPMRFTNTTSSTENRLVLRKLR